MIIELILLVLGFNFFEQINCVNIDCDLSADPSYESLLSEYNVSFSDQSKICGFKVGEHQKDSQDLNLDTELNNLDVQTIVYRTTSTPILPPELFKKFPRMNRCIFYNLSSTVVDRDWFKHAQGLKQLIFYRNEIPVLEDDKFVDLKNLLELDLKECRVEQIEVEAFLGLGKLEKLNLDGNKLTVLHPNLFKDLPKLKELHISNNPLTNLSSAILQNLVNLENFFMSGSFLATLSRDIFKNNRKLRNIDLHNGKLSKLSNKMFSGLMDLESLNLKNNSCISELISNDDNGILIGPLVEDLLAPCSCTPASTLNTDLTWRYFLIYLGLVTVFLSVLFICKWKFFQTDNIVRKMNSSFRIKDAIESTLRDYVRGATAIHGLNYMADGKPNWLDRTLWSGVIFVFFMTLSYYCLEIFIRWRDHPVVLGFDETPTPIYEIPFPSVSFCPSPKILRRHLDLEVAYKNYSEGKADNKTISILEAASLICPEKSIKLKHKKPYEKLDMLEILNENGIKLSKLFTWKKIVNPRNIRLLTDDGRCDTFNAIDANLIFRNDTVDPKFIEEYQTEMKDDGNDPLLWSMEGGYQPGVSNYPYRSFDGQDNGLQYKLAIFKERLESLQTFCNKNPRNFKLIFNHPAEVPRVSGNRLLIPFNRSVVILITPKITKTSDSLKSYDPSVRQCYFTGERQLKFFQIYTKSNCELECLTNLTLRYCNCSAFFMPRGKDTEICQFYQHHKCLEYATKVASNERQIDVNCDLGSFDYPSRCNCLPPCNEVTYDYKTFDFDFTPSYEFTFMFPSLLTINEVTINYKGNEFITILRSEQFGFIDFISSCGGLMGLFLGISIFSVFEIIYFCVFRMFYRLCHRDEIC